MALDTNDLKQIRDIFNEGLETIVLPRFDQVDARLENLEKDVSILKTDVAQLKTDVAELKTDVAQLKTDVAELKTDVAQLKTDMREVKIEIIEVRTDLRGVKQSLTHLDGRVEALENDIKEIYGLLTQQSREDKKHSKLSLEQKILIMHAELVKLAHQAKVTLP